MTRDELTQMVQRIISEIGAITISDKGKVMGQLMPQVRGKADGTQVNELVTEILQANV